MTKQLRAERPDKRLAPWRRLKVGCRCRFRGRNYMRGAPCIVVAAFDDRIDGLARYEVEFTTGVKWDCCRYELQEIRE